MVVKQNTEKHRIRSGYKATTMKHKSLYLLIFTFDIILLLVYLLHLCSRSCLIILQLNVIGIVSTTKLINKTKYPPGYPLLETAAIQDF